MSESLAVRHRPRRFADVSGQRHLVAVLRAAAAKQSPPQQILLAGPSGTGKTTLARIFAAALFCEQRTDAGDACGQCQTCVEVTGPHGRHPDVIELDAASHGGIEQIREIGSAAHIAPMRAPWKLYIIDEAHGLTAAGGQAALRLIEEPPAHTLFALATTDPDKLPTALRGRCLHLEVLPPTRVELLANLERICTAEGWSIGTDILEALLDAADPALGVRGTVMMLEKLANHVSRGGTIDAATAHEILGVAAPALFADLTDAIRAGDRDRALRALTRAEEHTTAPVVRTQLSSWSHRALREDVAAGRGTAAAVHWLSTISASGTFPGALDVAVAKMAAPHLAGDLGALEALVERAEAAATGLAHAPSATPTAPPATPTPAAVAATPARAARAPKRSPEPPAAQEAPSPARAAAPAAESQDSSWQPVSPADPDLVALMNAVGKGAPRAALLLRRATVARSGHDWLVQLAPSDVDAAGQVGLAERLTAAVTPAGGRATVS